VGPHATGSLKNAIDWILRPRPITVLQLKIEKGIEKGRQNKKKGNITRGGDSSNKN